MPLLNDFVNSKYCGKWRCMVRSSQEYYIIATGSHLEGKDYKCQHMTATSKHSFILMLKMTCTAMYGHSAGTNHECSLYPECRRDTP